MGVFLRDLRPRLAWAKCARNVFLVALLTGPAAPALAQTPVEIELVLAVDASASVDERERLLQQQAYVKAFRDPDIQNAIAALGPGGLAVTYLEWSSLFVQEQVVGWRHLRTPDQASAFASEIAREGGKARASGTAIGEAVIASVRLIDSNRFKGRRRIVDVSADDRYNSGSSPAYAKTIARRSGVTVNGLAIDPEGVLASYFQDKVITGPDAFVVSANSYEAFGEALKQKLLRELKPHAPVADARRSTAIK